MSKAVFWGLGIGPGDPGLITVKAIDILNNADIICVPRSNNKEESIAYEIVKQYIHNSKIIDMPYSMAPEIKIGNRSGKSMLNRYAIIWTRICVFLLHLAIPAYTVHSLILQIWL